MPRISFTTDLTNLDFIFAAYMRGTDTPEILVTREYSIMRPLSLVIALLIIAIVATISFHGHKSQVADTQIFVGGTGNAYSEDIAELLAGRVPNFGSSNYFPGGIIQGPPLLYGDGSSSYYLVGDPSSAGLLTNLAADSYNKSVAIGANNTLIKVKQAHESDPTATILVEGTSQGADSLSQTIKQLEASGYDTTNINFVLTGNVDRTSGGIFNRIAYSPILGGGFTGLFNSVSGTIGGPAVGPSNVTQSNYSHVTQVSNQYDLASDAPAYALNPAAWLNTFLGFAVYGKHTSYNANDININDPNNIITTNASGTITDILIPAKDGQLPILLPLESAGVSSKVVWALDPFVRAIIETGYDRPQNGTKTYPDQSQGLRIMPPPSKWGSDMESIMVGWQETVSRFSDLTSSDLTQTASQAEKSIIANIPGASTPITNLKDTVRQLQNLASSPDGITAQLTPTVLQSNAATAVDDLKATVAQLATLTPTLNDVTTSAQLQTSQLSSQASLTANNLQNQVQQLASLVPAPGAVASNLQIQTSAQVQQLATQALVAGKNLELQVQQLATQAHVQGNAAASQLAADANAAATNINATIQRLSDLIPKPTITLPPLPSASPVPPITVSPTPQPQSIPLPSTVVTPSPSTIFSPITTTLPKPVLPTAPALPAIPTLQNIITNININAQQINTGFNQFLNRFGFRF